MNKITGLMMMFGFSVIASSFGQKISADKVPSAVSAAFKAKIPAVEKAKWEMEDSKDYEVNFKMNDTEQSAVFDASGNWKQTESEMKTSALPEAIQQTIAKQFAGYKMEKAEKFEDAAHGSCFEVEIEKGEKPLMCC